MILNKIKQIARQYFTRIKIKRAEILFSRLAKIDYKKSACTRCIHNGGSGGYFSKWNTYKSMLDGFFKRKKSPYGVCFVCRGGEYVWKIDHIVKKNETLSTIAKRYDIVWDGSFKTNEPKLFELVKWNKKIDSEQYQPTIDEIIIIESDFYVWEEYLKKKIKIRFKNGYQQHYDNFENKWKWFHRTVVSTVMGENITNGYEVHHIDHDKNNNNPLNLIPLPKALHQAYHKEERIGKVNKSWIVKFVKKLITKKK